MASGTIAGGGNGEKEGSKDKQKLAESKVYTRKSFKGLKTSSKTTNINQQPQNLTSMVDSETKVLQNTAFGVASGDSSSQNRPLGNGDGCGGSVMGRMGFLRQESKVTINLSMKSKREALELRRKLESELNDVRSLVKKIEGKDGQKAGNGGCRIDNPGGLKRIHSEYGSVGAPRLTKPLNQLNVSVTENNKGLSDNMEKEKRTPKANKFYRNSEFLLAKDRLLPSESNKKSKSNSKRGVASESGHGSGLRKFPNKILKSCATLVDRLIKHKHGWVFNKPVDPVALGLHDYFDIIKNPMDLGSVKFRLNTNWYKSPKEFAEDVRLTFQNAMLYNAKGQDVHIMAEELLKIFEEKWSGIEADYVRELGIAAGYETTLSSPTSKKALPTHIPSLEMRRPVGRSESITHLADPMTKTTSVHPARSAAPKKPKAKDPNKRDMTYDEKQKLSSNLQNLPNEKLESIVQIIRKRNPSLCQNDDEIEVDIDSVDTETLWELDRFVTNFKKSLSKNKRKAELTKQAEGETLQHVQEKSTAPTVIESPKDRNTEAKNFPSSHAQMERKGDNASRSSNSSGSSTDTGSSSGDTESGSSSGSEA